MKKFLFALVALLCLGCAAANYDVSTLESAVREAIPTEEGMYADTRVTGKHDYEPDPDREHPDPPQPQPKTYTGKYYDNINPESKNLKSDLTKLISQHKSLSYDGLWTAFVTIDDSFDSGCYKETLIADVYSDFCWKAGKPNDGGQQCGIFHKEGDCYNREHGWPKSWWGGFSKGKGAQTDLFLLWPSDGYVNARRGNLPLGHVADDKAEYTSSNGSKVGKCTESEAGGRCFEIADMFKGDFARSYFYTAVAYANKFTCCNTAGTDGAHIKPWMEKVLREWHKSDPVSEQEMKMNNVIQEKFQGNRSPFIDHPEWVDLIEDF